MANCMLTTIDNPFDPFEQFTSWLLFDVEKGYNTCSYLARLAHTDDEQLSQKEVDEEVERAIDEIIEHDFLGVYIKVTEGDVVPNDNETVIDDNGSQNTQ